MKKIINIMIRKIIVSGNLVFYMILGGEKNMDFIEFH